MPRVTLADVAQRAGTSTAVVSYVINDGPRPVADATRARVEAAIRDLGYRPNLIARALASRRTRTIGLVVPDISNAWFSLLASRIEAAAARSGLVLLLGSSGFSAERESAQVHAFAGLRVDGVILAHSPLGEAEWHLDAVEVPLLCVHHAAPPEAGIPSVVVDNVDGGRRATEHLIAHGHAGVACLTGDSESGPLADRAAGWRHAVTDAMLDPSLCTMRRSGFTRRDAYEQALDWLRPANRPSAVFCTSDELAVGVLRAAGELGLAVPEDLAIVGFDDITESQMTLPPLSTMRQPVEQLAATAVDILLELGDGLAEKGDVVLPVHLEARATCGCAQTPRPLDAADSRGAS